MFNTGQVGYNNELWLICSSIHENVKKLIKFVEINVFFILSSGISGKVRGEWAFSRLHEIVISPSRYAHPFSLVLRPEIYALQILHGNQHTIHSSLKSKNLLILVFYFLQHV